MAKKKFSIEDYDNILEGIRQKHRKQTTLPLGNRLSEAIRRRKPKLPRI